MNDIFDTFINNNIELIDNNQFTELFEKASKYLDPNNKTLLVDTLDEAKIPYLDYMTTIPARLYEWNKRTEIHIPSNIITIQHNAFAHSKIQKVTIDAGCQVLYPSVFFSSNLHAIDLPNTIKVIYQECFYDIPNNVIINYDGIVVEWNKIKKIVNWYNQVNSLTIKCKDDIIQMVNL